MKPERSNYEIWLIDYLDGTLDNNQVDQLMLFLDENPDIKEELADILTYNIKPVSGSFKYKNSLKRSAFDLSDKQFEYLCISAVEHDLSEGQIAELESIIAGNPGKRKTFYLYKRAILVAPEVKFRNKATLRKLTVPQKIFRLSVAGLSAAAGIAILVTLFNMPGKKEEINMPLISVNINSDTIIITATAPLFSSTSSTPLTPSSLSTPSTLSSLSNPSTLSTPSIPFYPLLASSTEDFEHVNISKLDFKQEMQLNEKDFTGSLVAINTTEIQSAGKTEKAGFNEYIAKIFRERILKNKTMESGSLKAYEIADAGILGLNKLFGWQMSLKQNRDEKGELKSLYFNSRILKFNAPVRKNLTGT